MRVMIWVTHLLGVGHFHRAVRIARGLVAAGADVTIVNGGFPLRNVRLGEFGVEQLPPVRSPDVTFKRLVGPDGEDVSDEYLAERRKVLIDLADGLRPAAIVTELFPFGRWKFQSELVPLIEAQRERSDRPAIVASIRDILVPPRKESRLAVIRDLTTRYFDRILVHGDERFIRLEETLPLAREFAERIIYTGYVVPDLDPGAEGDDGRDEVIVSAGGSAFGGNLLAAAIRARPLTRLSTSTWRVLAGQALPDDTYRALRALAEAQDGVIVERARADFPEIMARARLSISQAGYNTACDVLAAGIPAVFAPFAEADESEQSARVDLLAQHGLAVVLKDNPITEQGLAGAVDRAAELDPPKSAMPRLDGAAGTANAVLECARTLGHV